MKRALSILLICLLMFGSAVSVAASEHPEQQTASTGMARRWSGTNYVIYGLEIDSSGRTYVDVEYALYSGYKVSLTVTLQKLSGASWTTDTTWTASGSGTVMLGKNKYVSSGTYRVKVVGEVTTTSGSYVETVELYSNTAYC